MPLAFRVQCVPEVRTCIERDLRSITLAAVTNDSIHLNVANSNEHVVLFSCRTLPLHYAFINRQMGKSSSVESNRAHFSLLDARVRRTCVRMLTTNLSQAQRYSRNDHLIIARMRNISRTIKLPSLFVAFRLTVQRRPAATAVVPVFANSIFLWIPNATQSFCLCFLFFFVS